jgi:hypothetical protein
LAGKFDLVEQSKRCASFFLHYLVDELAVKLYIKLAQSSLNQVEVVDFGLFVLSSDGYYILDCLLFHKCFEVYLVETR